MCPALGQGPPPLPCLLTLPLASEMALAVPPPDTEADLLAEIPLLPCAGPNLDEVIFTFHQLPLFFPSENKVLLVLLLPRGACGVLPS